jgi:GNAT superfamily N-acetyltransferase
MSPSRMLDPEIRDYEVSDESRVLDLLSAALGAGPAGGRAPAFFRWKHLENPFGKSYMLVAICDDVPVGFRSFMRWEFCSGGRTVRAVRAVDTATHPAYQGRGIFSRLTQDALARLRAEIDFVFNTPNSKSRPGYLKMGWQVVGDVPVAIRIGNPVRFALRLRPVIRHRDPDPLAQTRPISAESAACVLEDRDEIEGLLSDRNGSTQGLETPRTFEYLRWRYAEAPLIDYRAVREERGGRLEGIGIFRVRPRGRLREATVTEILVRHGNDRTARRLLGGIVSASHADHLTCSTPALGDRWFAPLKWRSLRAPCGIGLVVNTFGEKVRPDPTRLSSWSLSLGDLELF